MGKKSVLLLLTLVFCAPLQWAQSPAQPDQVATQAGPENQAPPANDEAVTTIRSTVQEVNVIFTATDKKGRFKKDLKPQDLAVLDDGRPPARVNSFSSQTDLPLRVGLLMDVSGSITDRFTFEQESAIKFFNQILRPDTDKAFVLAFDSIQRVTQDFTDNTNALAKATRELRPGGGTALYDAVKLASVDKLMKAKADRPVRKVIILLSDGEDNQSRVTRAQAIEAARRGEVIIYAISTNNSNTKSRGDKMLERLAEETGGRAFFPNNVDDVAHAFNTIQEELRSQYALSYKPADFTADGRYRTIQISDTKNKNVVIRARKGYFAPHE